MRSRASSAVWCLFIPALLFVVTACESVLFIELEESDKLIVVNGAITDDASIAFQVSRTRHILDNADVVPLEKATVRLYEEDALVGELYYQGEGYYGLEGFLPDRGKTYSVEVENTGYPSVKASCVIPDPVTIREMDTASVTIEHGDDIYYYWPQEYLQIDVTIDDPPGEDNFYLLYAEADRSWTEYRDTLVKVVDSIFYNNQWNYFLEDSSYTIEEIHRFTDHPYITTSDIVVEAVTSHGVLFSDQLIEGKAYSFRGNFYKDQLTSADSALVDLRLLSISESYYKYLKSRQQHYDTKENYLAVPVMVFSNVEDGAGFFGGYSSHVYTMTTFVPEHRWEYWYSDY